MKRYILEGTWSGYRASQRRVCHRVVVTKPERYKNLTWIGYSDGTSLNLTLRPALPRERIKEIHGYDDLIDQCLHENVNRVDDLSDVKKANETSTTAVL